MKKTRFFAYKKTTENCIRNVNPTKRFENKKKIIILFYYYYVNIIHRSKQQKSSRKIQLSKCYLLIIPRILYNVNNKYITYL